MGLFLVLGFLAMEIWLLLTLIETFGATPLFLWMLATGTLGVFAIRRQGIATLRVLQTQTAGGELPAQAVLGGLLVLAAGVLMILPGVMMDIIGLALLLAGSLRQLLALRLQGRIAAKRPDLQRPVVLEGEYRSHDDERLR